MVGIPCGRWPRGSSSGDNLEKHQANSEEQCKSGNGFEGPVPNNLNEWKEDESMVKSNMN